MLQLCIKYEVDMHQICSKYAANMHRGRGTGEAGEAAASPEIQRLTEVNTKFSLPEKNHVF